MPEQEKALSLNVYLLDAECEKYVKPVHQWLAEAAGQAGEGLHTNVIECEPRQAAVRAPFSGSPFLLAGSQASLERCFSSASEPARRVFDDCAYSWTLSDKATAVPAVNAIAKAHDRTVALSWNEQYYNYVLGALQFLQKYEGLAGLSISTHRTRNDIERIATAYQGAFSPVLILGGPGSGKEVVSRKLWQTYCDWRGVTQKVQRPAQWLDQKQHDREPQQNEPAAEGAYRFNLAKGEWVGVACGWFGETLLQDQLFGHERGAFTGADRKTAGLLEKGQHGCIFLDDFDVAPPVTLGALLRVMSTDWGEEASFSRLGGNEQVKTNAWLLFATNADIPTKVEAKEIRPDFIYRFEDRVIHLRPLAARPADIPQIALKLWQTIWRGHKDPVGLGPSNIEILLSPKIDWPGNIRQLRALLSLAASRQRLTRESLRTLISEILAVGDYNHWVGIVLDPSAPQRSAGSGTPSCLSEEGIRAFDDIVKGLTPSPKAKTPNRIRLAQILNHAFEKRSVVAADAVRLNGGSTDTANRDLKTLAGDRDKTPLLESRGGSDTYAPIERMFRPQSSAPAPPPSIALTPPPSEPD